MITSVLVTAGPTRERIDPVRFVSNHSTGTFGYAIAEEALRRGLRTTLISGPVSLKPPRGARFIRVESGLDMRAAVKREFRKHACLIMAAAVSDWRVRKPAMSKLKKGRTAPVLRLVPNPDIVKEVCRVKKDRIVVGFALETGDLVRNAGTKLKEKNLDLIVANKLGKRCDVFGNGIKEITLIDREGGRSFYRGKTKTALAKIILDKILGHKI